MIKSDSNYCNSSSSSTGSDCLSDNSKSIDTVTQLFSNLLRSSESSTNLLSRSPNSTSRSNLNTSFSHSIKQECNTEDNRTSFFSRDQFQVSPEQLNAACDNTDTNRIQSDLRKPNLRQLPSFTTSSETANLLKSQDLCTPSNSKIPVLHPKSDSIDFYEPEKKTPTGPTGRKPLNPETLKRNNSTSKIPIRNTRGKNHETFSQNKSPIDYYKNESVRQTERQEQKIKSDRNRTGKYNHVRSKLAAYIHRPSKIDSKYVYSSSNIKSLSKSSLEGKKNKEDYYHSQNANSSNSYHIKRVGSRTSLDTYTCDYKMPLSDFSCTDCFKLEDLPNSCQKAREHLEQAAEHCRIKSENCRIIEEHERIIDKHRRLVLEHTEKANEHKLKAIAFILNRIT